jgi:hypothetical protein
MGWCFQSWLDYQAMQNDNFLVMIHNHVLALQPQNPLLPFGNFWRTPLERAQGFLVGSRRHGRRLGLGSSGCRLGLQHAQPGAR